MIFQVRIVNYHQVCIHVSERAANGCAFAHVLLVAQPDPVEFLEILARLQLRLKTTRGFYSAIRGAIIHHNYGDARQTRGFVQDGQSLQARLDQILLVVGRDNYGERGAGAILAACVLGRDRRARSQLISGASDLVCCGRSTHSFQVKVASGNLPEARTPGPRNINPRRALRQGGLPLRPPLRSWPSLLLAYRGSRRSRRPQFRSEKWMGGIRSARPIFPEPARAAACLQNLVRTLDRKRYA